MKKRKAIIILLSLLILGGCTVYKYDYYDAPRIDLSSLGENYYQEGMASWYGEKFHGRKTANGERYDMYGYTAAHRTLPFNTEIIVVNMENGKKVRVRVNDRGPFVRGRILDLSYGAAKKIGMIQSGVVKIRIYKLR